MDDFLLSVGYYQLLRGCQYLERSASIAPAKGWPWLNQRRLCCFYTNYLNVCWGSVFFKIFVNFIKRSPRIYLGEVSVRTLKKSLCRQISSKMWGYQYGNYIPILNIVSDIST